MFTFLTIMTVMIKAGTLFFLTLLVFSDLAFSSVPRAQRLKLTTAKERRGHIIFDLPISYNGSVQKWIRYFQTDGRPYFTKWLERSYKVMPTIQRILARHGLPRDLAYLSMIESGFSNHAVSTASAVGPWQFIKETGSRYGLRKNSWLDERRDLEKSTKAASKYLRFLYQKFGSWYLAAAGYNAGENKVNRLMKKYQTRNFWTIAGREGLASETKNYVPKLIAAMLIAKAPALYGFRDLNPHLPVNTEHFYVPGGTHLRDVADAIGITYQELRDINTELLKGYIPATVSGHLIRIPFGTREKVKMHIKSRYLSINR